MRCCADPPVPVPIPFEHTRRSMHRSKAISHPALRALSARYTNPLIAGLSLAILLLASCSGHRDEDHEGHEHGRYPATTPLLKDTVVQHDYVCQIHSEQHIEMRALEEGYLQEILVDEGQHVKEGQLKLSSLYRLGELDGLFAPSGEAATDQVAIKTRGGRT